jgi:BppA domain 1
MAKYLTVVVCLVALSASFCFAAEEPVNLLKNPSLEELNAKGKLANWGMRKLAVTTTTKDEFRTGKQGVTMVHPESEYSSISQSVPVKPNTVYTATAWIKGKDIVPKAKKGCAMARLYIGKPKPGGTLKSTPSMKGTFDWKQVTVTFETGDYDRISFLVYLHKSTGTLWVDDVSLVEGTPKKAGSAKKHGSAKKAD